MALPLNKIRNAGPIGIGCAYLTSGSLTRHDDRLIQAALDAGARHFDVAPSYGLGTAEYVLGRAVSSLRDDVTIVTKAGSVRPVVPRAKLVARSLLGPIRKKMRGTALSQMAVKVASPDRVFNFDPDFVRSSLEGSLRALDTGYVDAFLLHMPRREHITDELLKVVCDARDCGKVSAIGLATTREDTDRILAAYPNLFDIVQYSWSALEAPLEPSKPYRVTHRALMRSFAPLRIWFAQNPDICRAISATLDVDLTDDRELSRCLIGAALAENKGGTILVASRSIERTRMNIQTGLAPQTLKLGKAFVAALRTQEALPSVSE